VIDCNSQASAGKKLVTFIGQGEQRLTTQTERSRSCWQASGRDAQSGSHQCLVRQFVHWLRRLNPIELLKCLGNLRTHND